jgi:hypothetical protein
MTLYVSATNTWPNNAKPLIFKAVKATFIGMLLYRTLTAMAGEWVADLKVAMLKRVGWLQLRSAPFCMHARFHVIHVRGDHRVTFDPSLPREPAMISDKALPMERLSTTLT